MWSCPRGEETNVNTFAHKQARTNSGHGFSSPPLPSTQDSIKPLRNAVISFSMHSDPSRLPLSVASCRRCSMTSCVEVRCQKSPHSLNAYFASVSLLISGCSHCIAVFSGTTRSTSRITVTKRGQPSRWAFCAACGVWCLTSDLFCFHIGLCLSLSLQGSGSTVHRDTDLIAGSDLPAHV